MVVAREERGSPPTAIVNLTNRLDTARADQSGLRSHLARKVALVRHRRRKLLLLQALTCRPQRRYFAECIFDLSRRLLVGPRLAAKPEAQTSTRCANGATRRSTTCLTPSATVVLTSEHFKHAYRRASCGLRACLVNARTRRRDESNGGNVCFLHHNDCPRRRR
jgi:hypothetical protein